MIFKIRVSMNDLITPKLITQYPTMSATARNWISRISDCKWVEDYFAFLNKQLSCLSNEGRKDIRSRLVSSNDNQYYEAVAELVYIAFWNRLKWRFEKDPKINGKTPDFKVFYDNSLCFYCDVTIARLSRKDNSKYKPMTLDELKRQLQLPQQEKEKCLPTEPIEQAHRFLTEIDQKVKKYREISTNVPFVICFFIYGLENLFYLDDFQIRNALLGKLTISFTNGEVWHQPSIQITEHNQAANNGIFGFEENKILTAVIICTQEFYTTSNKTLTKPKPHYPRKAKFSFSIYANPLGAWANKEKNPFSSSGLSVNGLADATNLEFCAPREIEFY